MYVFPINRGLWVTLNSHQRIGTLAKKQYYTGSSALTNPQGNHCCLGFLSSCKIGQELYSYDYPDPLPAIGKIYQVNDEGTSPSKETELTHLFHKNNIHPVFFGQFRISPVLRKIGESAPLGTPSKFLRSHSYQA